MGFDFLHLVTKDLIVDTTGVITNTSKCMYWYMYIVQVLCNLCLFNSMMMLLFTG